MNLFATANLGTEEGGHCNKRGGCCREVLNNSQCMDFLFSGTKKSGGCNEVAVSGVSTIIGLLSSSPIGEKN